MFGINMENFVNLYQLTKQQESARYLIIIRQTVQKNEY